MNPPYPIVLGAPADMDAILPDGPDDPFEEEFYPASERETLISKIVSLKSQLFSRDTTLMSHYDRGMEHGRIAERREIADSLDRNAERMPGNGSPHDAVVRNLLRSLARQLRADLPRPSRSEDAS